MLKKPQQRRRYGGIWLFVYAPARRIVIRQANPLARAVRLSLAMRDRIGTLTPPWNRRGYELGMGIGVSLGYATIGAIGLKGDGIPRRSDA